MCKTEHLFHTQVAGRSRHMQTHERRTPLASQTSQHTIYTTNLINKLLKCVHQMLMLIIFLVSSCPDLIIIITINVNQNRKRNQNQNQLYKIANTRTRTRSSKHTIIKPCLQLIYIIAFQNPNKHKKEIGISQPCK